MMRSSRTERASTGSISGSGLEQAKITGRGAISAMSSALSRSGPETPTKISAPVIASRSDRGPASLMKRGFWPLRSVRPERITPWRSTINRFSLRGPQADDAAIGQRLALDLQRVEHAGGGDDGRSVLVIVEDRHLATFDQRLLD